MPYDSAPLYGVDPSDPLMKRIMRIESGGNPNAVTGSYKGLYQLSQGEFDKYGGGDIFNPADNTRAAMNKFGAESNSFQQKYGRPPSATDLYMIHQQGAGGYDAHLTNPDAPAWQNMLSTAEGRQKGAGWAKQAIWGNVPDNRKAQYGSVDNLSSKQFVDLWRNKVEGGNVGSSVDQNMLDYQQPPALSAKALVGPGALSGLGLSDGMITNGGKPVYDLGDSLQNAGIYLMGINNPQALGALAALRKEGDVKTGYNEKTGNFYAINKKGMPVITGRDPGWVDPTEEAYKKEQGQQFIKTYGDLQQRGADASNDLSLIQQAKTLLTNPAVYQGFGGDLALQAKSLYKALGGDPAGLAEGQEAKALANQLTLKIKNAGGTNTMPGALSDPDLRFLMASNATLGNDPAANQRILDQYERSLRRSQELAEMARTHNNGRLDNAFYEKVAERDRRAAQMRQREQGMDSFWITK